eukprot:TRINITY_DN9166_c0_g1_i1.p1 TRINITY_DN9166_c0_g1~~TRINITY_DN9166_c0_g1_i1.p1  ORF type:complete len:1278 (-),score=216.41 TRINITY_DN9166_c0_g1_i1:172-4005(-)
MNLLPARNKANNLALLLRETREMSDEELGEKHGEWLVHSLEPHKKLTVTVCEKYLQIYFGSKRIALQSTKKRLYIPMSVLWFSETELLNEDKSEPKKGRRRGSVCRDASYLFTLIGPEDEVKFHANQAERNAIKSTLNGVFARNLILPNDRVANYIYKCGAEYMGQWSDGQPHGQGKLITKDGKVFDGEWKSIWKAGSGVYVDPCGRTRKLGWKITLPAGPGAVVVDLDGETGPNTKVSPNGFFLDDIYRLFSKGDVVMYKKGDIILKEGAVNRNLYFIQSGSVFVEKGGTQIMSLGDEAIFGEYSLLDMQKITATVIAEKEAAIAVLSYTALVSTLQVDPALSKRWNHCFAQLLSRRLRALDAAEDAPSSPPITTLMKNKRSRSSSLQKIPITRSYSGALNKVSPRTLLNSGRFNDRLISLLDAWEAHHVDGVMQHVSRGILFLDPFTAQGCFGAPSVRQHLTTFFNDYPDVFFSMTEILPVDPLRYMVRTRISRLKRALKAWAMFHFVFNKDGCILHFEAFYDSAFLTGKSDVVGNSSEFTEKDIELSNKFEFPSMEHIFQERETTMFIKDLMPKQHCKAYLSSQHLCFVSNIFGFSNKLCVPLAKIVKITKDDASRAIKVTFHSSALNHLDVRLLEIWFDAPYEYKAFYADLENLHSSFATINAEDENVADMGAIEKKIKVDQQYKKIPEIFLSCLTHEQSCRIYGPKNGDQVHPSSWKDSVSGISVSGYPMESHWDEITKKIVQTNRRQGDPICDQFCVDLYENGVLFSLADGCNWGWKPRNAAFNASRRFIEYLRSNHKSLTNAQIASLVCSRGFSQAQQKILEAHDKELWEVGTTTMLGGVLMQSPNHHKPWVAVMVGVGDCKAFHFKIAEGAVSVSEITVGSRSGSNINDATDPGGRLGPQLTNGQPDLRNFDTWYASLNSGDLLMVCTDGVHDNLDPQGHGLVPMDLGLTGDGYEDWDKNDPAQVEQVKIEYQNKCLQEIFMSVVSKTGKSVDDVTLDELSEAVINYCLEKTKPSREFMQDNPTKPLPKDYKLYPGKMDHITCLFIRAQTVNLRVEDKRLLEMVAPMSHPISGIQSTDTAFTGNTLLLWLKNFYGLSLSEAESVAQNLLTFNYLMPLVDDNILSSFRQEMSYELNVIAPIMGKSDWEKIMQAAESTTYRKGDVIIQQESTAKAIYHCIRGQCKVNKTKNNVVSELATINTFEIFGELNFLEEEGTKTFTSVVAESDVVEVQRLSETTLNLLCAIDEGIGGRFYHYLATIIARRLKKRGI